MKVKITKKALTEIAARAERVADGRSSMPVLGMVVLRAEGASLSEGARLSASATDLYTTVQTSAASVVEVEGSVAVDAKELKTLVTKLADGDVRLSADGTKLEVRAGRSTYRLATGAPDDQPAIPEAEGASATFDAVELGALLEAVVCAVSADSSRQHLAGVHLDVDAKVVRAVTTDGHRLHLREATRNGAPLGAMLVPPKGVALLRSLDKGPVELAAGKGCLFATQGDTTYGVKLIDEQFPPYAKVIPQPRKDVIQVSASDTVAAIRRLETLLKSKVNGITLQLTPGLLVLRAESADTGGTGVEEISCDAVAERDGVGMNAAYLAQAIVCASNDVVELHVGPPLEPVVVRSEGYTAVVMPMRTGDSK